jgi:hypothetical protein
MQHGGLVRQCAVHLEDEYQMGPGQILCGLPCLPAMVVADGVSQSPFGQLFKGIVL